MAPNGKAYDHLLPDPIGDHLADIYSMDNVMVAVEKAEVNLLQRKENDPRPTHLQNPAAVFAIEHSYMTTSELNGVQKQMEKTFQKNNEPHKEASIFSTANDEVVLIYGPETNPNPWHVWAVRLPQSEAWKRMRGKGNEPKSFELDGEMALSLAEKVADDKRSAVAFVTNQDVYDSWYIALKAEDVQGPTVVVHFSIHPSFFHARHCHLKRRTGLFREQHQRAKARKKHDVTRYTLLIPNKDSVFAYQPSRSSLVRDKRTHSWHKWYEKRNCRNGR